MLVYIPRNTQISKDTYDRWYSTYSINILGLKGAIVEIPLMLTTTDIEKYKQMENSKKTKLAKIKEQLPQYYYLDDDDWAYNY